MNATDRGIAITMAMCAGVLWGLLNWLGIWAVLWATLPNAISFLLQIPPVPLAAVAVVLAATFGMFVQLEEGV